MRRIIVLLVIILSLFQGLHAQDKKLFGHWYFTKVINQETGREGMELTTEGIERYAYNKIYKPLFLKELTDSLIKQTSDTMRTPMTRRDSARCRSKAAEMANDLQLTRGDSLDLRNTIDGIVRLYQSAYVQFNPDGTYAISFEAGKVDEGKYKVNKKIGIIITEGDNSKYFYYFLDDQLVLRDSDGSIEVKLKKQ